jgi:hypothetical protein
MQEKLVEDFHRIRDAIIEPELGPVADIISIFFMVDYAVTVQEKAPGLINCG